MKKWLKESKDGVLIEVTVRPGSSRSALLGEYNEKLKIAVNAPPVDGKANEGVIKFLSKILSLPKSSVYILRGQSSKEKIILIKDLSILEIEKALERELPA